MTGSRQADEKMDPRRKRARFRAWHRGTREMDLILGPFADNALSTMTNDDLDAFERLLEMPDTEMLKWFTGATPVPDVCDTPLFLRISRFRETMRS